MNPKRKVNNELLNVLQCMHEKDTGHNPFNLFQNHEETTNCKTCRHIISLAVALEREFNAGTKEKREKPAFHGATCGQCMHWKESEDFKGECWRLLRPVETGESDGICIGFQIRKSVIQTTPPEPKDLICPICHEELRWFYYMGEEELCGYLCGCTLEELLEYRKKQEVINDTKEM